MENQIIEIKKLDINGNGIGYFNKKIVFVPFALPGEEVEVEFVEVNKTYIKAKLIYVKTSSLERIRPICPAYKRCGGCSLMHLDYKAQLVYKRQTLTESLRKYTGMNVKVENTIPNAQPLNYRNKVSLAIKKVDERIIIGLYEENSHYVVDVEECPVQDKELNNVIKQIKVIIAANNVYVGHPGLKYMVLRRSNINTDMQLTLVYGSDRKATRLVEALGEIPEIKNIYMNINVRQSGPVLSKETSRVYGNANTIKNRIGDKTFKLGPNDFFQLNSKQTKVLYDIIKDYAKGSKNVVDCYSGVGTIGQYLDCENLRGIEIIGSAVKNANENCKINHVKSDLPKPYVRGEVGEVLKRWCKKGYNPDLMLFDPPRVGLDAETIETIRIVKPVKIIYVSCNPSTLGKDLNQLKDLYKIVKCQPVDMFSYTEHVETVVLLKRK